MPAKKKGTTKAAASAKEAADKGKEGRDAINRIESDAPSPSTRASNRVPGTEIESGSGPQERGPARGARRPYTETLPGARRPDAAAIVVLSEEEERQAKRRKEILDERKKLAEDEGEQVEVVATRMAVYGEGAAIKRYPAGSKLTIRLKEGQELPTWAEKVEDYEERVEVAATRAGGRGGRRARALSAVAEEDAREDLKRDKDDDVL